MFAIFLLIYFGIYGGAHVYIFWFTARAFPRLGRWRWAVGAWLAAMVCGPILVRVMQRHGLSGLAGSAGFVALVWMAISMWITSVIGTFEAWNVLTWLVALRWKRARRARIPLKGIALCVLLWLVFACTWAPVEARQVRLERHTLRTSRLPAGADPIRIVQISDVHAGGFNSDIAMRRVADLVREADPDLLLSTGDMVDGYYGGVGELSAALRDVHAPLGKFAVTGNHEYYHGIRESLEFHERCGFRMLRQEAVEAGGIRLAGVDDPAGLQRGMSSLRDEDAVLPPVDHDQFVVLLKHRPFVRKDSVGRFDLQLSGHTHGGQLFPFSLFVRIFYPLGHGLRWVTDGSWIYISRGTGSWGPPMRLFAPPEVTLFTLVPAGR